MTQAKIPQGAQDIYVPANHTLSRVLGWAGLGLLVVFLVWLVLELASRLKSPTFFILRIENGWVYALGGLLATIALLFGTAYLGKIVGERSRGRAVSYWAVLGDQLTHLIIWIIILAALYPLVFIIGTSLDPLNRLVQGSLGAATDPLLVRSRVLPPLEGSNFSNYAALFEGVVIYAWQWAMVGIAALGLFWLAVINLRSRAYTGTTLPPSLQLERRYTSIVLILVIVLFFAFLLPAQFTGNTTASRFLLWIRNTFLISGITGVLAVILTTTAGYAMARLRFPGRFQTLMFFIFIQMFPNIVALVAIFSIIKSLDLLNTFTGLILAYSGGAIAFGTWIYKGYVESLPASLEESALVDGTTRWGAFTKIVLPLSGPMLVFIFLLQFIGTYAEFLLANVLLSGAGNWNVGVGLRSFGVGGGGTTAATVYGQFAAAAVLGAIPIVALFYSFQQFFVSGTVSGGVKE